jgi:hypothetical protein
MVAALFVLLISGAAVAFMLRPQSDRTMIPSPTPVQQTPTEVPPQVPTSTIIPTKTPEEREIDTIDVGTDEAIFNDILKDIDQL